MVRSRSYIATPPGATIKEQLQDRGMSQKEFAARMNVSEKHMSRLINGDVKLTPEMADKLEMVLGIPTEFWMNLEAIYQKKKIKAKKENALEEDKQIAKKLPYREMSNLGWVPPTKESDEKVIILRKFFEVVELSRLEDTQITRIACRRLKITEKSDLALMAWAQEAKIKARSIETAPININALVKLIPAVRNMTRKKPEEFCKELKENLAKCGIALVFLPHLKGSFLQGASFKNDNKIVVGLTVRGRDADKFWFSFFHELAHVVLRHIDKTGGTSDQEEKQADQWARDSLIPKDAFNLFKQQGNFTSVDVRQFAESLGLAPGIVVGRLQYEELIPYSQLNNLKEKYLIV